MSFVRPVAAGTSPLTATHAARALLLAPPELALPALDAATAAMVEVRRTSSLPTPLALPPDRAVVLLLDAQLLADPKADHARLVELASVCAMVGVGAAGECEPAAHWPADLLTSFVAGGAPPGVLRAQIGGAFRHAAALVAAQRARAEERHRLDDLTDLARVGVALGAERDLLRLLELVLSQARRLTGSDAGSLYLVETATEHESPALRFRLAQNHTLDALPLAEYTVPLDETSLAGYAAVNGEAMVIDDVYLLPEDVSYRQNRSFDERFGYRTKSVLVIPMTTHRDEVIGVLQLINRKRTAWARLDSAQAVEDEVIPFDAHAVELVRALAAQAGVAIENSLLYAGIERLFEGFVTAAVTAIEARDPTTSGHSARVATLTTGLAEAVMRDGSGPYSGLVLTTEQMRELRYAALLHDFGKVGVREKVLVKQKKLYSGQLDLIRHRFAYLLQAAELEFERERADYLAEHGMAHYAEAVAKLERKRRDRRDELRRFLDLILHANEPTVLETASSDDLAEIHARMYVDFDGVSRPLLREEELRFLTVRRGNLDERERLEIESHVSHTFRFLQQIPWTRELRGIPSIAYLHHEKLNGSGYPRGVKAPEIPVQARMMTIADIYDALTATDRPYKRAVPPERALDILHDEAREGALDRDLLATFVASKVWEGTRDE